MSDGWEVRAAVVARPQLATIPTATRQALPPCMRLSRVNSWCCAWASQLIWRSLCLPLSADPVARRSRL